MHCANFNAEVSADAVEAGGEEPPHAARARLDAAASGTATATAM
jgi:hypothetical protein